MRFSLKDPASLTIPNRTYKSAAFQVFHVQVLENLLNDLQLSYSNTEWIQKYSKHQLTGTGRLVYENYENLDFSATLNRFHNSK